MSNEVNPCPFCATIPQRHVAWHCQSYFYRCPKCELCVGSEDWTRRPTEDALRAKLKIAIEALEECRRFCNEFDYEPTYNDIENIEKALAKLKE